MNAVTAPRLVLACLLLAAHSERAWAATACARDGQGLSPATEDFSPKQLQRTTRGLFGPAFAAIIRDAPWASMWRGDWLDSQATYFIEGFGEPFTLPRLRFPIAAPAPLAITVELQIETKGLQCIAIELPHEDFGPDDGFVRIHAPMVVVVAMSVGTSTERWKLKAEQAMVAWQREDGRFEARLDIGELRFGLPAPGAKGAAAETLETLRHSKDLVRAKALLVRSLEKSGRHRAKAISLLADLTFQEVPGDTWIALRRLQSTGKLSTREVDRLGWLTRLPVLVSDQEATIFTTSDGDPPPRIFVGGREFVGWTQVGAQHELRVPVTGLAAVRAEFDAGSSQAFVTVFERGVRIRLREVWGPTLEARAPGARCGFAPDKALATCLDAVSALPVGSAFELSMCGGPAAQGSSIEFGVSLVPSLPGLYIRDAREGLRFDPTYGGKPASAACSSP